MIKKWEKELKKKNVDLAEEVVNIIDYYSNDIKYDGDFNSSNEALAELAQKKIFEKHHIKVPIKEILEAMKY